MVERIETREKCVGGVKKNEVKNKFYRDFGRCHVDQPIRSDAWVV